MSENDLSKETKNIASVLSDVLKMAGDNPEAKQAAKNLGNTAVTITDTINTALLPIAAVNFAFKKAKDYFSGKFQSEFFKKTQDIPVEYITEPKPSIAAPLLQGLAFSSEEPDLKELFLSLLKTSMDKRTQHLAHPAYVEIIKQLTAEEAGILKEFLTNEDDQFPVIRIISREIKENLVEEIYQILLENVPNIIINDSKFILTQTSSLIDNWIRLGLFTVDYTSILSDENAYSWFNQCKEYIHIKEKNDDNINKIEVLQGIITTTSFGKLFGVAIGVRK